MRQSKYFIQTLRDIPNEAEVISHQLMMRSGMIKKIASGIYTYLPLGLRTIRKVENIVRECMNEKGAIELLMNMVQPAELWQSSGRWAHFGKELLRFKDRSDRDFCLGPTHEEVVTEIVHSQVSSYKQLPLTLYQIQTKFRDEVRPRFGLMRGREFIMKDGYSFDIDDAASEETYLKMFDAYKNIFTRCGLRHKAVEADTGAIGGSFSHEFMVLADTGEDAIISCKSCDYSANLEKAVIKDFDELKLPNIEVPSYEEVATPNVKTVEEVASFFNLDKSSELKVCKTIVLRCVKISKNLQVQKGEEVTFVAVLLLDKDELNIAKVRAFLGAAEVELATDSEVLEHCKCPVGSLGPVNLPLPILADNIIKYTKSIICGANKDGFHLKNVLISRDVQKVVYGDFRNAKEGDICPNCGGEYEITRGIEVGHIFKLGTKYSLSMGAKVLDKNGKSIPCVMGCYGIGIGRTAAAAIEQHYDEKGIIWPKAIAPFEVVVIPVNTNDEEILNLADKIYADLLKLGVDVIIDDRNERAGVKLNDADLIGYPIRVNVGRKSLDQGFIEVFIRHSKEVKSLDKNSDLAQGVKNILDNDAI